MTAQFIGYDPVEIRVDTNRTMLIAMNENKQALNEVVVVGYGAKKNKKSITTGTVVTVNEQANKDIPGITRNLSSVNVTFTKVPEGKSRSSNG